MLAQVIMQNVVWTPSMIEDMFTTRDAAAAEFGTYINTTIGSFVCTKCSGMLRGINPPHRIKSISMSSFSADEVASKFSHKLN